MPSYTDPISLVLATDSFLVGDGLEAILADVPDIALVGRVRDIEHLVPSIEELRPEAVLICVRSQVVTTTAWWPPSAISAWPIRSWGSW